MTKIRKKIATELGIKNDCTASNTWYTLHKAKKKKSNLLLKITWIANENRKLQVRVKTVIRRKLIAKKPSYQ